MASRTFQISFAGLVTKFSRLSIPQTSPVIISHHCARCVHTQSSPLLFHATSQLWGAPMKKKKKVDPAVLMQRETKRKKKIERQMKRLEKFGRRLKPVDEIDGDPKILSQIRLRRRPPAVLTFEEGERRALLQKQWSRSKLHQHTEEAATLSSLLITQDRALDELKFESEELYNMAIQLDEMLIGTQMKGPTATPPIKGYFAKDGEYIDTTKTYD
ncbi:hypothetical protein V1264_017091 [Littorina saxatilis]|uniref:Large ribosomal subunit protein mL40 n=2 Tax=Littorina saxatilis TaxID=31220 RepID=A0AAN9GEV1_9CAEN